jgi:GNAT superfamily N-acetyltransferase
MLGAVIRPFEDRDAEPVAALLATNTPWLYTAAGIRHRLAALPPRAHRATWVAEVDDAIVGWGEAEFDWTAERSDVGTLWVLVDPSHRRRGYGSELFERGAEHLHAHDAGELRSWSFAEGETFLEQRGFQRARVERLSAVDPRTVDTSGLDSLPPDVRVVALADVLDRLPEVHALFAEAFADMPADHPERNVPYDEWLSETIGDPHLSREGSAVVLVTDEPAALSWVGVDREHGFAEQHLTGTARAHRRRGLARFAKLAVARWCAREGIVRLATGNDSTNAGMLAINTELGFRPFAEETEWVKRIT